MVPLTQTGFKMTRRANFFALPTKKGSCLEDFFRKGFGT